MIIYKTIYISIHLYIYIYKIEALFVHYQILNNDKFWGSWLQSVRGGFGEGETGAAGGICSW